METDNWLHIRNYSKRTCAVPSVTAVDAGRRGGGDGARLRVVVDGARPVAALPPHQRRLLAAEFDDDALNTDKGTDF